MIRAFIAVLVGSAALAASAAEPVAFVADVKGSANIEGDGRVNFLAELVAGTRLLLGTGAAVSIAYAATGAEFSMTGPGVFTVTESEVRADKGGKPVRKSVQALSGTGVVSHAASSAAASVRMRGIPVEAPAPKTQLEYPLDTRISMLQPVLRWKGDPEPKGYSVVVIDDGGKTAWKGMTVHPGVRVGAKLAAGMAYTWRVTGALGPVGEGHFETLSADSIAKVQRSGAAARTFSDRVMHAFLLQDLGASQEAKEAWAVLARERPEIPELAALSR
ncbi:MAG TPA: hypothetical protein VMG61_10260 [Usitatibacter sp.]|nr:hypothetical protein [Usitatibacter sp.]